MFRFLFLLFLLVPLIEIYFLIKVGSIIGATWTVFAVVFTAVLGAWLIRLQGFSTLQRAQLSAAQGQMPAVELLEGVALVISGVMLLTPGFFTDSIGFLLLTPPIRQGFIKRMVNNGQFVYRGPQGFHRPDQQDSTIIEGEVVDDDDKYIR